MWQQNEQIEPLFVKARDDAEQLIPLFGRMPVPFEWQQHEWITSDGEYDMDAGALILLSAARQRDLRQRFKQDADMIYTEVKRGAVSSFSEVPKGIWLLLFVLGFNEIYAAINFMLSSPLLLIFLLMVAGGAFVLYQSRLLLPLMQAAYRSAGPAAGHVLHSLAPWWQNIRVQGADMLRQVLDQLEKPIVADEVEMTAQSRVATPMPGTPQRAKPARHSHLMQDDANDFYTPMRNKTRNQ